MMLPARVHTGVMEKKTSRRNINSYLEPFILSYVEHELSEWTFLWSRWHV